MQFIHGNSDKNVSIVVTHRLCASCGTCAGVCPSSCINIIKTKESYIPKVNNEGCIECGLCLNVCPSYTFDYRNLNINVFGKEPEDWLVGNYVNAYIGYSADSRVRYNSSSGGLVTQLLIYALDNKIIDGAIVTKMRGDDPLQPKPFIARTREEVIAASKSKYCPVPLNIMLKEVMKSNADEKLALVGLPCHIQGVRKAESIIKSLKERILLHFGLFCGHAPTFSATEFLLQKLNVKRDDVKKIEYRDGGWPGNFCVLLRNGAKVHIPFDSPYYWGLVFSQLFFTKRCSLCSDKLSEFADLSFGDAWLPEIMAKDRIGTSVVISRSKIGEKFLSDALTEGLIKLKKVEIHRILQSQCTHIVKNRVAARNRILKLFNERIPTF